MSQILENRQIESKQRLEKLKSELGNIDPLNTLENIAIYATGSYARLEASEHSDIDLFFVNSLDSKDEVSRLDELRFFAQIIEIGEKLRFPTFSGDGEYLQILSASDMLGNLGGPEDDYHNYFTARMLLLLESYPLLNVAPYKLLLEKVVEAYFRDYPDHAGDFKPVFLINDILRFWKTLCLNYEHKRNRPREDPARKLKQQIKNFKLKFSRLMTCFGTVTAICGLNEPTPEQIIEFTTKPPLERFTHTVEQYEKLANTRKKILAEYQWFMTLTALETSKLEEHFKNRGQKQEIFRRADEFGAQVFKAVDHIADKNDYSRYLVV